ncbi:LTA synthase family protein [Paenibacillus sambharensis]|uniref:LTA synthase family protein n=1 Tax=Paenibacillus sambharensis TaxID=1803190 RepID=A0A2W1LUI3_9BACL|nr:LTA synthase family protein [Paenibacillus sambharensis]PZD95441.1 LTA synthase family protein [Paenibacillus sambharensis]
MNFRTSAVLKSPFAVFTLLLAIKFCLASAVIFGEVSLQTFLAALPPAWAAFALVEAIAVKRRLLGYFIVNLLLTAIYFAVIMYYKYFGIIVTYHALAQIGQVTEVKGSVFQLLHPYYLLIFTDILMIAALAIWSKRFREWGNRPRQLSRRSAFGLLALASIVLCALQIVPNRHIVNELKQAERMGIINYQLYIMLSSGNERLLDPTVVTLENVNRLKETAADGNVDDAPTGFGAARGRHIIYIQLEALQDFLINLQVGQTEITPILNGLLGEAVYYPNVYQQVGAGNTSDAEFTANTSFYTPPAGAASEVYGDKSLPSLPKLLEQYGYRTATFHTNDVTFWNRDELYDALGFDHYYDQGYFEKEDLVHFGASDEMLYRRTAEKLEELAAGGSPIYANVISMSAHHPFNLPVHKNRISLPERFEGTFIGDYLRSQHYADYALGLFAEQLKADGIWDNSLIVIYGDHMGVPIYSLTDTDRELLHELIGEPYNYAQMLNIPLLLIAPGALEPGEKPQVGGHSDIMPTVANLAGISLQDHMHFGQDLLNITSNLLPLRYYLPSGSLINDEVIYVPGSSFEDGTVYPLQPDSSQELAGAVTKDQFERSLRLLQLSHSYVSRLPSRE